MFNHSVTPLPFLASRESNAIAKGRVRKRRRGGHVGLAVFLGAGALGGVDLATSPQSGAAVRTVPFRQYSSCPKLSAALRTLLLPLVGPYGLNGGPVFNELTPRPRVKTPASGPATTVAPAAIAVTAAKSAPVTAAPAAAAAISGTAAPAVAPAPAVAVDASPVFDSAAASANSSATNVQEIGVDEGDSVENDGRYLFATVTGAVRIIDTETGKAVANLGPANGSEQLLLDKNRLAITRTAFDTVPETVVDLWDVTNRSQPTKLSETHLEGSPLAVRTIGGRARIVLQSNFGQRIQFVQPQGFIQPGSNTDFETQLARAQKINRGIVQKSQAADWLPRSYVIYGDNTQSPVKTALDCREVGRPANATGIGFTWVATLDLDIPNPRYGARGSGGVIAAGQTVYASAGNLFVATPRFSQDIPIVAPRPGAPVPIVASRTRSNNQVDVHKFDLTPPDGATYRASGTVPGALLNSFSMSEFDGNLRVATTQDASGFGSPTASSVFVLRQAGRELNIIGRIDGLGRTERIYAVRFVGDIGYVVTFRRTDPLYVLDLRNPTSPRLIGELKIPGYSSYLQPIGPGRLLGIGQDADANGRVNGTQLSLFDVSDPTNPTQLSTLKVGGQSNAEYDHHAFLWWPATKNIMIPSNVYTQNGGPQGGLLVASLENDRLTEKGRIAHEDMTEYYVYDQPIPVSPVSVSPVAVAPAPVVIPAPPGVVVIPTTIPGGFVPQTTFPSAAPRQPTRRLGDEPINRSLVINAKLVTVSANAVKSSNLDALTPIWYLKRP
jgi:Beta propeller domain